MTAREMLAALQADLFEKEAIFQRDGFAGLQEKLQIYLQEKATEPARMLAELYYEQAADGNAGEHGHKEAFRSHDIRNSSTTRHSRK